MPSYEVTSPDGKKYKVTAPDGATQAQIIAYAQKQFAQGATQSQASQADKPDDPSFLQSLVEGATNIPDSAAKFAGDIYTAVRHPIDTATTLGHLAHGVAGYISQAGATEQNAETAMQRGTPLGGYARQQMPIPQRNSDQGYVDALMNSYGDRYGDWSKIKHTLATDPVGLAADASIPLTLGTSAALRIPGATGRVAETVANAARAVNPIRAAAGAIKTAVTRVVPDVIGGLGTHTGGESLRMAAQAGYQGGDKADAFLSHMRGGAPIDEIVSDARAAVDKLREQRGAAYRAGMGGISKDKTVLDLAPVESDIAKTDNVSNFNGQDISPATADVRQQIKATVSEWKGLDPQVFHTPEGLDALKQKIGSIRDGLAYGTPERLVAEKAYGSVRSAIVRQAPAYAKVMKDYERASDLLQEIKKTLSLNPTANVDTSIRKLQSVLRNNVNANYGRRAELANTLAENGSPHLMNKIAGQSLSSLTPRGLGAAEAGVAAYGAIAGHPLVAAALPLTSPRLMGEASYYAGKIAGAAGKPIRSLNARGGIEAAETAAPGAAELGRAQNDNYSYADRIRQLQQGAK